MYFNQNEMSQYCSEIGGANERRHRTEENRHSSIPSHNKIFDPQVVKQNVPPTLIIQQFLDAHERLVGFLDFVMADCAPPKSPYNSLWKALEYISLAV